MGTIKCKTCASRWTVSTPKTEKVIRDNHVYLHPGHRTITWWEISDQDLKTS